MKEYYPWVSIGIVILGFLIQGFFGSFRLGRAVEQMRLAVKDDLDEEREKIVAKIEAMEARFDIDQETQDHRFGEVGHAMREKIATVENKLREVEIYGRDNYVKIPDFEKAIDRMGETFKAAVAELKEDMRRILRTPSH